MVFQFLHSLFFIHPIFLFVCSIARFCLDPTSQFANCKVPHVVVYTKCLNFVHFKYDDENVTIFEVDDRAIDSLKQVWDGFRFRSGVSLSRKQFEFEIMLRSQLINYRMASDCLV